MDSSEPMHLGSPLEPNVISSPTHQSGHGQQFLPGFLMGNFSQVSPQKASNVNQNLSRPKQQQTLSPIFGLRTTKAYQKDTTQRCDDHIRVISHCSESHLKEKGVAPPLATLMDELAMLDRHAGQSDRLSSNYSPPRNFSPVGMSLEKSHLPLETSISPSSVDLTTPTTITSAWVTVFGFPPQQTSLVLKQFSQFGTILTYCVAGGNGNWVHINYKTLLEAKRALSRNGRVVCNNMMLGVLPCKISPCNELDQALLEGKQKSIASPAITCRKTLPSRNLTAINSSSPQVNDLTPHKSNVMITKAMDFLFG